MCRRPSPFVLGALALATAGAHAQSPHWNRFRGPHGSGRPTAAATATATAYPIRFDADTNRSWRVATPPGHSSPCIVGDALYLTGVETAADDDPDAARTLVTLCLDRATGDERWRQELVVASPERHHRVNSLASSTPTADAERVYAYFGSAGLVCYAAADGDELWRREFEDATNTFGTATSPILAADKLILCRDTNGASFLAAFAPTTGEPLWQVDRTGFRSGWSTPTWWRNDGVDELLVYGAFRLTGYALADGTERWSVPGLADEPCVTPVVRDGIVYVSSYNMRTNPEVIGLPGFAQLLTDYDTDGNGSLSRDEAKANASILSRMDADGEGDHPLAGFFRFLDRDRDGEIEATEWPKMRAWLETFEHANALVAIRPGDGAEREPEIVWQHGRGVPECPSPLVVDDRIWLVKNGGLATCVDARTGDAICSGRIDARGPCYASPVTADGNVYVASARGRITVLDGTNDELTVLARNDLDDRIMATPALVDGTIYVRTERATWAFRNDR